LRRYIYVWKTVKRKIHKRINRRRRKSPTPFIKSLLGASDPTRAESDFCSSNAEQRAEGIVTHLKQNEAQSARAETTHKGVN